MCCFSRGFVAQADTFSHKKIGGYSVGFCPQTTVQVSFLTNFKIFTEKWLQCLVWIHIRNRFGAEKTQKLAKMATKSPQNIIGKIFLGKLKVSYKLKSRSCHLTRFIFEECF